MFFYISKFFFFLIHPFSWIFLLLLWSLKTKSIQRRKSIIIASIFLLYFFSNGFTFNLFGDAWEYETINPKELTDTFDLAVVLGGFVSLDDDNNLERFNENSDRIFNVLPLYFDGRVKKLLISGGSGRINQEEKESEVLQSYLIRIGVNEEDILLDKQSRNTYENAKYSAEIIRKKQFQNILLSTSTMHMPRAIACFQKQGIAITPFAVDERTTKENDSFWMQLIPNPQLLVEWYKMIHEWVGITIYKVKGYC